ncbi:branched-chain amino acid ABC transporter permease [Lichenihabitans psoromatis]|uniref:branched-chain amino acid ABC transporter permease n=1 Tax=Lichenihabitans psoromatis TaxID=2528642 RepID=UPI0010384B6D|nr:branched-chain amino acid ABC transporter permease [Lichenihabitans psoromatis]
MKLPVRVCVLVPLVVMALSLGACTPALDRDQARMCRMVIEALTDDAAVTIVHQSLVVAGPDPTIRVDYRLSDVAANATARWVKCSFDNGARRLSLTALRTETGPLSEPRVFMLNRFWLESSDRVPNDPLPIAGAENAVVLPVEIGYWLQQLVNACPSCAVYGLLAAAYSLVYGLIGRINLAFGAFAAIGGLAALIVVLGLSGLPVWLILPGSIAIAILCTLCHGLAISRLVFQPLQGATGQQGLVATVGLSLFLGEYLRLVQGSQARWIVPMLDTPQALARDDAFTVTVTPIAVLVSLVAGVAAAALLRAMTSSRFGREWRAFSDDPRAAALFGIGRNRIVAQTFALASALAGLAGAITILMFGDFSVAFATTLGLKALTAAVLGGIGSVPGAFLGGVFVGMIESGWSAAFPIVYRDLAVYGVLVATLIWRPGGFLGFPTLVPRRV